MRSFMILLILVFCSHLCLSQKIVFKQPVEFAKGTFQRKDYDSYYLNDPASQNSLLILKDNKKVEYLLLDKNMKLVSKFSPSGGLSGTVFDSYEEQYVGGTAGNGKFHFVYAVLDRKLMGFDNKVYVETVDPAAKTVSSRELFESSKENKGIAAFGNYGKYFSLSVNNDAKEMTFHGMDSNGKSFQKSIKINMPAASKKKKLSDYFEGLKVIRDDEEPGLETATEKVKLFHSPGNIHITVNEADDPTYLLTVNTETFAADEKLVDHSALTKDEKGKSYINSYLFGENLYSLVLNKKNIRIAIYNIQTSALLKTHEINENTNPATFAEMPVIEERRGKRTEEKSIDDVKKLIRALDKGSEAIMMYKDKKGRIVVTIGTYDMIPMQSGGSSGSTQHTMSSTPQPGAHNFRQGGMYLVTYYTPGRPSHTFYSANFYKSTRFKLLVDPATLNFAKGMAPLSATDQIKDYMSDVSKKAEAKNQFNVNGKEYFGYYDRELKMYMIEEIIIRK